MDMKRLGIMAALPQELGDLIAQMRAAGEVRTVTLGRREYYVGDAHGRAGRTSRGPSRRCPSGRPSARPPRPSA